MGWNGSDGRATSMTSPRKAKAGAGAAPRRGNETPGNVSAAPRRRRGLIAGLLIVIGAGLAAWLILGEGRGHRRTVVTDDGRDGARPSPIAEATPSVVTNAGSETLSVAVKEKPRRVPYWEVDASQTNGFTDVMCRKWEQVRRPRLPPVKVVRKKQPYEIFNHPSENKIAMYLSIEPGRGIIGTPIFGKKFEADFEKSCQEPIVIKDSDGEYERTLKNALIEAKIELKNRMAAGESLNDIMLATHTEMQKLGAYKREVEAMVRESLDSVSSKTDADTLIEAANKMLESKGIGPIGNSPIIRARVRKALKSKDSK